jgi:hypothetical protein
MAMASMSNSAEVTPVSLYNTRSTCTLIYYKLLFCVDKNLYFLAVKRLMREAMEMKDATELFYCQPIEVNI